MFSPDDEAVDQYGIPGAVAVQVPTRMIVDQNAGDISTVCTEYVDYRYRCISAGGEWLRVVYAGIISCSWHDIRLLDALGV